MHLQDDEMEFTDELFQKVYFDVINQLNQEENINIDTFINHSNTAISSMVTNILMDEEKYTLSDWERRDIFVKGRDNDLPKLVIDTVFNLRRVLIDEKIASLVSDISEKENNDLLLEEVVNYSDLKKRLFKHLNRVV